MGSAFQDKNCQTVIIKDADNVFALITIDFEIGIFPFCVFLCDKILVVFMLLKSILKLYDSMQFWVFYLSRTEASGKKVQSV